jgi:molybdopterin synthase catalytic subunit
VSVRVQSEAFSPGTELEAFTRRQTDAGAVVSFSGIVRNLPSSDLEVMRLEHYPGMTERALDEFRAKAVETWNLADAMIIHRYGDLKPGETIMMVATAASPRRAAFEAAEFLMDYLKSRAPFWKKEITASGATWVASKDEDESALSRWKSGD